jgi:hypothetical protein
VPTGIPHNLLPEEDEVPDGEDADEDATTIEQEEDSDELSDEMIDANDSEGSGDGEDWPSE